jgi:hypothetical protein
VSLLDIIRRTMTETVENAAPVEEPPGYASRPSFVKSRPENNAHYLAQYEDTPWYSILKQTDEQLEELIPGYNIAQIKFKFGGLCYYFDYPAVIPTNPQQAWHDSEEKVKAKVRSIISYAEGWIRGYRAAEKAAKES